MRIGDEIVTVTVTSSRRTATAMVALQGPKRRPGQGVASRRVKSRRGQLMVSLLLCGWPSKQVEVRLWLVRALSGGWWIIRTRICAYTWHSGDQGICLCVGTVLCGVI